MNHNADKYWIEDSELLTEVEKTQMATALRELENQGVIEYSDGRWALVEQIKKEKS
jgi:hypothetical protein